MASIIAAGRRRPVPATAHTGVPASPAAAARTADPVAATIRRPSRRVGLDQREVGGSRGDRRSFRRHQLAVDVVTLQALHEGRTLQPGVDGQHPHVTPAHEGLSDHPGPADRGDGRAVGKRIGELVDGVVEGDLLDRVAAGGQRVRAGQEPRAQPPQGPAVRVPLDDAPAGDHQPGRIEPQSAQRTGGLPHERLGVGSARTRHVAEPLDRVHHLEGTAERARP